MSSTRTSLRALILLATAGALLGPVVPAPADAAVPAPRPLLHAVAPAQVRLMHRDAPLPRRDSALRRSALDGSAVSVVPDISGPPKSQWQVTYTGFNPQAQAAFQRAVDIWASVVSSTVPIKVDASFAALGPGVLGSAGSSGLYGGPGIGDGQSYYPSALADALAGEDVEPALYGTYGPDITAQFTNDTTGIYYGTDGLPPAGTVDFETVVLHELGHGLGFFGLLGYDASTGQGFRSFDAPGVFDRSTVNGAGTALLALPDNSTTLGSALTSGQVRWSGAQGTAALAGTRPLLYAPNPWQDGSSYSHLDEAAFPRGNANSLMTPAVSSQEVVHDPGAVTVGIFKDMGWTADRPQSTDVTPPTVTITSAPGALSRSTTVTFAFSATDDRAGAVSFHCRLDGTWTSCTSPRTWTGLANATHTFALTGTDAAGNSSALQQRSWRVDSIAPVVTTAAVPASSRATTVGLSYGATDTGGTGVTTYDVRYRQAPWWAGFGALAYPAAAPRDWQAITATSVSLPATKGFTYCLSVRAHDLAGNVSAWSAERCTTTVLDDATLTASSGWTRGTGSAYYASTVSSSSSTGVTLSRTTLQARRLWLLATRCPGCGSVGVYWDGALLKTINLASSTSADQQFFSVADLGSVKAGTITVRTLSTGSTRVDGVATTRS